MAYHIYHISLFRDLYHAVLTSISMGHNFFNAPLVGHKRWQIDHCPWFFSASQQTTVVNWPSFHSAISQTVPRNVIIYHNSEVIGQEDLCSPMSHLPLVPLRVSLSGHERARRPARLPLPKLSGFFPFSLFCSFFRWILDLMLGHVSLRHHLPRFAFLAAWMETNKWANY